jgi:hypothetical protein
MQPFKDEEVSDADATKAKHALQYSARLGNQMFSKADVMSTFVSFMELNMFEGSFDAMGYSKLPQF